MAPKTLDQAIAKAKRLPLADRQRIARNLVRGLDDLAALREKRGQGVRSLDAGLDKELDIEELIARANAEHAER